MGQCPRWGTLNWAAVAELEVTHQARVEMAGKAIENVYDYTHAIQALKIGEEVTVVVERDGTEAHAGIAAVRR